MTYKRVLAGLGVTAVTASTLVLGPGVAFAADATIAPPVVIPISSQVTPPSSYPLQVPLPVVADNPADASIARGVIPYDEIYGKINSLMANSNRVSAQVVGQSALGKDIYLVTVTSAETAQETAQQAVWRDKVKHNSAAAAIDPALLEGYKIPIWFNANIHGNEWEGTDATLNYIEDLATSSDPAVEEMLGDNRLYFTVTNNPDGRALGQRAQGAGFDANRDMITGATPESVIIRDLSSVIQPVFYVDIHGYTNVLQIEPCGPPHGENYEYDLFLPHAYDAALAMEQAVVEANIPGNTYRAPDGTVTTTNTGQIQIPYRDIRAGWDDWPPIFTPQYVAYQGAITNTVELPLGRTNNAATNVNNARVDIEVAEVVINTAVDYVVDNSSTLLENQIEIFRRGDAGEPLKVIPADIDPATVPAPNQWAEIWDETDVYNAEFPRAFMIPMDDTQRSTTDAAALVDQLLVHGVEVSETTSSVSVEGVTYPAGTYMVDMHQPLRGMANVLLADGSDISSRVPDMYDISAWSLALLWGADVDEIGATTDPALAVTSRPIDKTAPTGVLPAAGSYLTLETAGVAEYQAINLLIDSGVPVSAFDDGSVILGSDSASRAAAQKAVAAYDVEFEASDGKRLLTEESRGLSDLTVGYVGAQDDRLSLLKLGFADATPVTVAGLVNGTVDLSTIDVLWINGTLDFRAESAAPAKDAFAAYLATGKGVAGRGANVSTFASTFGLTTSTAVTGTTGSNGIVSVSTPEESLFSSYSQDTAFISPAVWFTGLGENATVEQTYATEGTFISGHWVNSDGRGIAQAAGNASIVSAEATSGTKLVMFGTTPTYRAHPVGAFSQVARSLFWVGADGAEVADPVIVPEPEPTDEPTPTPEPTDGPTPEPTDGPSPEPTDEPTPAPTDSPALPAAGATTPVAESSLTAANKNGIVVAPSTAVAGSIVTVTVGSEYAGETVYPWIYSTPTFLGEKTVSAAGDISVMIPASLAAGEHRIAVLDAAGTLIGWADITITRPASAGLANTGVMVGGAATVAALLLLAGAATVLTVRRRRGETA